MNVGRWSPGRLPLLAVIVLPVSLMSARAAARPLRASMAMTMPMRMPMQTARARADNATFRRYEQQNVQAVPGADSVTRLMVPGAVQERAVTTARDDDSLVQALEHKIHCTCGCNLDVFTCRTTDFTCATSPAMHRLALARLDSNMTSAQVLAAFEAQYGQSILMEPPKRGFNWAAYVTPFIALAVGLVVVGGLMRRWIKARPKGPGGDAGAAPPSGEADDADVERLKRELEKFEA